MGRGTVGNSATRLSVFIRGRAYPQAFKSPRKFLVKAPKKGKVDK